MTLPADFDRSMYEKASSVLEQLGMNGEELRRQHPDSSMKELAMMVGDGVTAHGLTMVFFEEATRNQCVRSLVQELLYREILDEFPNGWNEDGNVRPTVKIGNWHYSVLKFASEYGQQATMILRALATTYKPKNGWIPGSPSDEQIQNLFDEYWVNHV